MRVTAYANFELLAIKNMFKKLYFLSDINNFLNSHVMWMKNKDLFLKTFIHSPSVAAVSLQSKHFSSIWLA
jgi:hypothetical protein